MPSYLGMVFVQYRELFVTDQLSPTVAMLITMDRMIYFSTSIIRTSSIMDFCLDT